MKKTHTAKLSRTSWGTYYLDEIYLPVSSHILTNIKMRKGQTVKLKLTHLKNGFKAEVVK